jgi:hypothetical protein
MLDTAPALTLRPPPGADPSPVGADTAALTFTCDPGGEPVAQTITLTNHGRAIEQLELRVEGIDSAWWRLDPPRVIVWPGEQVEVRVAIAPPLEARTGRYGFAVVASAPSGAPGALRAALDAVVEVGSYANLEVEVLPHKRTVRRRASYRVRLRNDGNTEQVVRLDADDAERGLRFALRGEGHAIPPNGEVYVPLDVRPLRHSVFDRPRSFVFWVNVFPIDDALGAPAAQGAAELLVWPRFAWVPPGGQFLLRILPAVLVLVVVLVTLVLLLSARAGTVQEASATVTAAAAEAATAAAGARATAATQATAASGQATAAASTAVAAVQAAQATAATTRAAQATATAGAEAAAATAQAMAAPRTDATASTDLAVQATPTPGPNGAPASSGPASGAGSATEATAALAASTPGATGTPATGGAAQSTVVVSLVLPGGGLVNVPVTVDGAGDVRVTRVERATPAATPQPAGQTDYTLTTEGPDGATRSVTITTYQVGAATTVTGPSR